MDTVESRGGFSSRLGFLLATAGAAVGLGNLWRFPYLAEEYGGGIFLLVYLILVVTFGVAMLITELAIGRRTGKSCFDALMELAGKHPIIGWVATLVPLIIVSYYCVIGGWVTKYFADYVVGSGSDLASSGFFGDFSAAALPGAPTASMRPFMQPMCVISSTPPGSIASSAARAIAAASPTA